MEKLLSVFYWVSYELNKPNTVLFDEMECCLHSCHPLYFLNFNLFFHVLWLYILFLNIFFEFAENVLCPFVHAKYILVLFIIVINTNFIFTLFIFFAMWSDINIWVFFNDVVFKLFSFFQLKFVWIYFIPFANI